MTLYADRPLRRLNQVLGDVLVAVLVYVGVRLGLGAHDRVSALATPGREAEDKARELGRTMRGASSDLDGAPVVGGAISAPFRALATTSRDLAGTAQAYQDAVAQLATLAGVLVAGVPIGLLLVLWLPRRVAWVVEASAAVRLMQAGPASSDLLAVRAMARQPLRSLAALGPDAVSDWRTGDRAATDRLARLELDALGLRPRGRGPTR
jgi:hypothetical protein